MAIAAGLNERKIRTARSGGWSAAQVKRVVAPFGRIDALGKQALCFVPGLARHRQRNHRVWTERDGLLLAGKAVGQPPELGSLRYNVQLKSPRCRSSYRASAGV
jgi:hypothetical protein